MQEESAQKLRSQEGHLALLAAMRIILPPECYVLAVKGQEPVVGNGHPMRVPAQVTEDLHRAAKGRLRIDHPILPVQSPEELAELPGIRQGGCRPCATEFLASIEALQPSAELAAKNPAQDLHGQEERIPWAHPAVVIRRQPASRNHAVYMGVQQQVLPPGMQNADETDFGAQVFRSEE